MLTWKMMTGECLGLLPAATRDLPAVGGFQPAQRVKKLTLYEQKKEKKPNPPVK